MSSDSDVTIHAAGLGKCYQLYDRPIDRLKQSILPSKRQYYREHWALKDITFDVRAGESIGIIGRNGSGKSTLLQLVAGILPATTGETWARGRVAALLELGSGFNPEFTGRENVYLNATLLGLDRAETEEKFDDIVAFSEIGEFVDQPVKTYSSGMFVRLAFSVIAHVDADVLIIDEALAVGDAFFVQKCMRFMRAFREKGTLLFVSHDTGSVMSLCDRTIWISEGEIAAQGGSKEVCEAYFTDTYSQSMGITRRTAETKIEPRTIQQPVEEGPPAQVEPGSDPVSESVPETEPGPVKEAAGVQRLHGMWFDADGASFGTEDAQIVDVALLDKSGDPVDWLGGGETVIVRVVVHCKQEIDQPIIGFAVKNRLGQPLFGDNTSSLNLGSDLHNPQGAELVAEFSFNMPLLLTGEYTMGAAIASGTMESHVQHHWIHDALVFKVDSSSLAGVLVGVPMNDIQLRVETPDGP